MTTTLLNRPLDLLYFVYFATHIPVTLLIDFQAFYPPQIVPQVLKDVLAILINHFKDPLMGSKEPLYWFLSFLYCELFIQFIFFFLACYGLWKNCIHIRLGLIAYGSHVATTVLPTIAEVLFNPTYSLTITERLTLVSFYFPYFFLPLIMLVDSYLRISSVLKTIHIKQE
ncbi:unnamed protein product [Cunninghamella blakesleeana]